MRDCPGDWILGSGRPQLASLCELGIEVILCVPQFRSKKCFFLGAVWFFSGIRGKAEKLVALMSHMCSTLVPGSALVPSTRDTYNPQSSYEKNKIPPHDFIE